MSDYFAGEIRPMAGNKVPLGWHLCDGSALAVTDYPGLFALLGYQFGGQSPNYFRLPDLRGRLAIGAGAGPGLPSYLLGATGGAMSVTLNGAQLPAHTHPALANSVEDGTQLPTGAYWAGQSTASSPMKGYGTAAPLVVLPNVSLGNAGGSAPIGVRQPTLTVRFIIALSGEDPHTA